MTGENSHVMSYSAKENFCHSQWGVKGKSPLYHHDTFQPIWIWGPNFVSSLVVQSALKRTLTSTLWFLYFDLEILKKERCSASKIRDDSHSPNHCSFPHHTSTRQHTGGAELIWDIEATCFPFKSCDGQMPWLGSFIADFVRINEASMRQQTDQDGGLGCAVTMVEGWKPHCYVCRGRGRVLMHRPLESTEPHQL